MVQLTKQNESVAAKELVDGGETALHSHAGGGGGLVNKANIVTTDGNGEGVVTFGTPYANTNYFIQLTAAEDSDAILAVVKTGTKTVDGFTVRTFEDKGQAIGNVTVYWATGPYSNP